jgi:hypothetical protein
MPVNPNDFNMEMLISSMKELRQMQLDDQVRSALEGARLKLDPNTLETLIHELESDIEEHIQRLERIAEVLKEDERKHPENIPELRRQEVAFQSGSDFEEVDSLCEAFSHARKLLAGLKGEGGIDVKLLFSNLPGMTGLDFTEEGKPANLLRGILDGTIHTGKTGKEPKDLDALAGNNDDFEALFDLASTRAPKNRLPKDWTP